MKPTLFLLLLSLGIAAPPVGHIAPARRPAQSGATDKDAHHVELVAAKKAEWDRLGVEYNEVTIPDAGNLKMLVVRAKRGGSKLNELAADSVARMGEIDLAYSPRNLDHELGHKTVAKYNHLHHRVYLPEDIDASKIPESVKHELLHAWLYHVMYQGKDSLFHGELTAVEKAEGLWKSGFYHAHMSFQELAAYPLSLDLLADEMKGKPPVLAAWKHLLSKTKIMDEVSRATVETLGDFAAAMKRGEKCGLVFKVQTFEQTNKTARWAHVERGNVKMKIPFFGARRPDVEAVLAAVEKRRMLVAKLVDEVGAAHRELRDVVARLEKGEVVAESRLAEVLDKTKAIRRLTTSEIP